MQVITSHAPAGIESGFVQAKFLWAYATLGERVGSSCFAALATRAMTLLPRFTAQGLSNTAWALASMDVVEPVCSPQPPRVALAVKLILCRGLPE